MDAITTIRRATELPALYATPSSALNANSKADFQALYATSAATIRPLPRTKNRFSSSTSAQTTYSCFITSFRRTLPTRSTRSRDLRRQEV